MLAIFTLFNPQILGGMACMVLRLLFCGHLQGWHGDAMTHLGLKDQVTEHTADYGHLPDLTQTNPDSDILFTWNGTTSGVKVWPSTVNDAECVCCVVPGGCFCF